MTRFATVAAILLFPAAAFAGEHAGQRVADAFVELGMSESKASCYGTTIAGQLDSKRQEEAASIVQSAENSNEVREAVMNSGFKMVNAFSVAHEQCGS